ncbi:hypothetical protein N431DRAFT_468121 [Stipitochalara longipes BDJ]|nr:hypothetical protein N431DRAFT_468121 [Stipitochalara longipes BDJ]
MTISNHTCPAPPSLTEVAQESIFGNVTFHHFAVILGGSAAAISFLIVLILMAQHATYLSNQREQYKIMKICLVIPYYSLTAFLSICFPKIFLFINAWFSYIEAVSFATLFLLFCQYLAPSESERELFFAALEIKQKDGPALRGKESLDWYRMKWIAIFQMPVVALLVAVATMITQAAGIYCEYSMGSKPFLFAHFWLGIASSLSLAFAFISILKFYMILKPQITRHAALSKLVAFKMIVGLTFIENIIFWILQDTHTLKPTAKLTFADVNIVIPALIICLQNVPLAIFFHYAYPHTPYLVTAESGAKYYGGFCGWRGWVSIFNPMEVGRGFIFAFQMAALQGKNHRDTNRPDEAYLSRRHYQDDEMR